MSLKPDLKIKAVELRRSGKTYSEIMSLVPVAKSTLSDWFREVHLSKPQKQKITQKRIEGALRGALARKNKRILFSNATQEAAQKEVGRLSKRELWLVGAVLYWAEGTKEKEYHPGNGIKFTNSDPLMIRLFLKWLQDICYVSLQDLTIEIYLHDSNKHRISEVQEYWKSITGIRNPTAYRLYFKRNKINTKRKNTGQSYYGILCVRVKRSSTLLRKITGWTRGIHCGVV